MTATLTMPRGAIFMDVEEMTYVDGGATFVVKESAGKIRTRLNAIISLCVTGQATVTGLGAYVGGVIGAVVGFVVGASWFGTIGSYARTAHNQVEGIISKYGTGKSSVMTSTWSTVFCTGISVTVA